jgi:hypothetical protein
MAHQNHHSHGNRRRGGPSKLAMHPHAQKAHQQVMRAQVVRPAREPTPESLNLTRYMDSLEQWCSLDFDDDIEFIPNLLTPGDIMSHSSGSERSSTVGSPDASPTQQPQTVAPAFAMGHYAQLPMMAPSFQSHQSLPIHQPSATRAIAIIDPTTGVPVSSPSPSVSPNRLNRALRW